MNSIAATDPPNAKERRTTSIGLAAATQQSLIEALCSEVGGRLGIDPTAIDRSLPTTQYGIDSLAAIEIAHAIEIRCKVSVSYEMLLADLSLERISEILASQRPAQAPSTASLGLDHDEARGSLRLSYGQEALWSLYKQTPASSAYNIAVALRVLSPLDDARLQECLISIVRRHPLLRARFKEANGRVEQHIDDDVGTVLHIKEDGGGEGEFSSDQLLREIERPFDLRNGRPFRVTLWKTREGEQILLFVVHHIVADLWSLSILVSELFTLYTSEARFALPLLGSHYAAYVEWQQHMLDSSKGEEHWKYWREQIPADLPRVDLPVDFPREEAPTLNGGSVTGLLNRELSKQIKLFSSSRGLTLSMTLLSVFHLLLYRYTQQSEQVIGCAFAGRNRPEWGGLLGYFVNSMPIAARISRGLSFIDFAKQIKASMISALEHVDYPLGAFVERMNPTRAPGRHPLFDCLFVYQQSPTATTDGLAAFALGIGGKRLCIEGIEVESLPVERRDTTFDLTLMAGDLGDEIGIVVKFNADLFEQATIRRLIQHFTNLAKVIVSDPTADVQRLPLLTDAEERMFLSYETPSEAVSDGASLSITCVSELFERHARMHPDWNALRFEDQVLTYGGLSDRSTAIACALQRIGVGPETPVAVCLERGIDLFAAMLGILKAGAIYVPLDPAEPRGRLGSMLRTLRPHVILSRSIYTEHLELAHPSAPLVDIETFIGDQCGRLAEFQRSDQSAAYIIFTSGSTGEPKGVCVERRQLLNYVHQICRIIGAAPGDGFAVVSTPVADLGNTMIFPALCTGGCLHIISSERSLSPSGFSEYCKAQRIDFLKIVPSHLATLLAGSNSSAVLPRRCVILGGESCSVQLVKKIHDSSPDCRILNHYGPTETVVGVLTHEIDPRNAATHGSLVPIGKPLDRVRAYVLDDELQLVPLGALGELYIGGEAISRGYYKRPAETAEVFIPDCFCTEPGRRMYKTGDSARYRSNGLIEFHGRRDHQIKLRGYRIEPAEIEAALTQHPKIVQAAVVLADTVRNDGQIAAFVVAPNAGELQPSELRYFLREHLPKHMIPGSITCLEALPLTPNGKLDRKALSNLAQHPSDRKEVDRPSTSIEIALASMWKRLIGAEEIGVNDDFFELGGHSLMATQMTSRLEEIFPSESPLLVSFFQTPTVAGLAEALLRNHPHSSSLDEAIKLIQQSEFTLDVYPH